MLTFIDMASTTDCSSCSTGLNSASFVMFSVHNRDIQLTGTFLTSQVEKNCIGRGPPSRDSSSLWLSCPDTKAMIYRPLPRLITPISYVVVLMFSTTQGRVGLKMSLERRGSVKRSASAVQRPGTAFIRPFTASKPRRPYSAYTNRGTEEAGPKFDVPETNREWWRTYVKVINWCIFNNFHPLMLSPGNSYTWFISTSRIPRRST